MIPHGNVIRLLAATQPWFEFSDQDVWTLFHSFAFDFSVWEVWGALAYGGRIVVVPFSVSRSPEDFHGLLAEEGITVLNQTPSAFQSLIPVDLASDRALKLRWVIFGGEALDTASLRNWFNRHGDREPRLVNMYGITETTVHVTYRPIAAADCDNPASLIGMPIPDLRIYLLDDAMEPVPEGVVAEMYVAGEGLARGYLHREPLTAERFVSHRFFPGEEPVRLYRTGVSGSA